MLVATWWVGRFAVFSVPAFAEARTSTCVDTIASVPAARQVEINRGNHATITMLYEWLFGALDRPVRRAAP